jgi:MFS family permease
MLRQTPAQNHGSVIGVLSAFYDLFVGAGSLLAGRIADRHGYSAAFLMAAIALTGAAIAGCFVFKRSTGEISVTPETTLERIA